MVRGSIDRMGGLQKAVREAVWDLGEATVQQVRDRLGREPSPAYTTVLSVMQKLEKAGWLTHRAEGRGYLYRPSRSREERPGSGGTGAGASDVARVGVIDQSILGIRGDRPA